jgi:DNA-binding beta-propeller fold protein YncE
MAGALWAASTGPGGTVSLRGLDLTTLAPVASITVRVPGGTRAGVLPALTANARDSRLYAGAGHTIAVINATTRRIIRQYQVTGAPIADVAVNPDDTRLYITRNTPDGPLTVADPDNGTAVGQPVRLPGRGGPIDASAGGVYLGYGSGMEDWIYFYPATDLARPRGPLATGGGGIPVASTVTASVVWLAGTSMLACADPLTGEVRVSARVPTPDGDAVSVSALIPAGGRLFAYYRADAGPSQLLIKLSPPAACTG